MIDLGDPAPLAVDLRDAAGALVNAATAALTITRPDGTTDTPAVPVPSQAGRYRVDYVPTQAGRHDVRWVFTSPTAAHTDTFDVREARPPLLVSLADVKAQLNITSTKHDEELRDHIEAATGVVERYVGPVAVRTVTETGTVRGGLLVLTQAPVVAFTSLTPRGGAAYAADTLTLDASAGIVRATYGDLPAGTVTAVYQAGRRVVPAEIALAAKVIVQHLWRTQNAGATLPPLGGDEAAAPPLGLGFAVPNRALELLAPHMRVVVA